MQFQVISVVDVDVHSNLMATLMRMRAVLPKSSAHKFLDM
jgi:hypothetical protein